jgi:large subunit ribosomal protein L34e
LLYKNKIINKNILGDVCMPEGRYRSRSYKRTFKKTPGGETVLHYKRKKPSKHICAECGKQLHSVPRGRPYQIRKLSKSKRRPNRPFGGNLCSECVRRVFKAEARL